jgi:hypothetical protein
MRRILVDHARENIAEKRGGGYGFLPLDGALTRLEKSDPRAAKVVELRFFGGLSIEETAEAMRTSPRTIKREWMFAKAWLRKELEVDAPNAETGV